MEIKRALTFRASSIGDCLMGKYLLENIHAAFPEARCGILVGRNGNMLKELFRAYPWLEVSAANRKNIGGVLRLARHFWGSDITVTQYSENKFSTPSKFFARLITKKGGLIGFDDGFYLNKKIYDILLPFVGEAKSRGLIEEEQKALRAAGLGVPVVSFSLLFHHDDSVLKKFGLSQNKFLILHLFSGSDSRGLIPKRRTALAKAVFEKFSPQYDIVLTGAPEEEAYAKEIAGNFKFKIAAGRTNITELINLIDKSAAVVSLDTGAAHIAAHIGKPLVVLARCEARSAWWSPLMYPRGVSVLCNENACPGGIHIKGKFPPCLNMIGDETVLDEIKKYVPS